MGFSVVKYYGDYEETTKSILKKLTYYRYKRVSDKNYRDLDLSAEELQFLIPLCDNLCKKESK